MQAGQVYTLVSRSACVGIRVRSKVQLAVDHGKYSLRRLNRFDEVAFRTYKVNVGAILVARPEPVTLIMRKRNNGNGEETYVPSQLSASPSASTARWPFEGAIGNGGSSIFPDC